MMEIVDIIMRPQFLVTMLAGVSAFATVLTLAMPILSRDRMTQRMKLMALERDAMRAARLAEMAAKDRHDRGGAAAELGRPLDGGFPPPGARDSRSRRQAAPVRRSSPA